jgi:glycosyltransferase involved in cell wall biosynthesis
LAYNLGHMSAPEGRPIRLVVVSHSCVVATNQIPWARLVARHPVDLTILAPRSWRSVGGRRVVLEVWPGLEGRVRPMAVVPRGHPNLHLWLGLGHAVRAAQPDVLFLDEEPYSLAAAQALAILRRTPAAFLFYAKQNLPKRLPGYFARLEQRVFGRVDVVAAVHPGARDVLVQQGCAAPIRLLPHVIDPDLYSPGDARELREGLGLRGFVVGYVGRLVPEKGVLDLLKAVEALEARTAGELSVLLVGDGPQRGELEAYAREHVRSRVVFTGVVPHTDAPRYYRAMDVLVLPSRTTKHWREQFGRTIIEALACGVAVVGSDSGSIPGVIEMTSGLVYPEGDVAVLAAALGRVMTDEAWRRELILTGRRRALEQLSADAVADTIFSLLTEALRRRTG